MYCRTPREEPTSSGRCEPGVGFPTTPVLPPYKGTHQTADYFLSALDALPLAPRPRLHERPPPRPLARIQRVRQTQRQPFETAPKVLATPPLSPPRPAEPPVPPLALRLREHFPSSCLFGCDPKGSLRSNSLGMLNQISQLRRPLRLIPLGLPCCCRSLRVFASLRT